ncbi:hypothetical protein AVEN_212090-1 [Araneus ventricosus]|uniref:Uncharacterized protein n=1 Tax=Araneus ventricosus TaxID=182803 RepID=A0A4Y2PL96_ARAVE|nr:hypothetical protein AVEN_212090-1 [Araneus ventricosus]
MKSQEESANVMDHMETDFYESKILSPSRKQKVLKSATYVTEHTRSLQNISPLQKKKKKKPTHTICSLCHAFFLHVSRNTASRDLSNGKNNSPSPRGLQESHTFIGADITGDEDPKQAR